MTDKLIERIKAGAYTKQGADELLMEATDRILADAKIIKAAEGLAECFESLMNEPQVKEALNLRADWDILAAYRAAVSERDT